MGLGVTGLLFLLAMSPPFSLVYAPLTDASGDKWPFVLLKNYSGSKEHPLLATTN